MRLLFDSRFFQPQHRIADAALQGARRITESGGGRSAELAVGNENGDGIAVGASL